MSEEQVLLMISCRYVIFCEELGNSADIYVIIEHLS